MRYVSTRGDVEPRTFCDILLEGLAPDGGLYVPASYPQLDTATLDGWRGLPYPALAFEVLSLFVDDVPAEDLRRLVESTYTAERFGSEEVTPLRPLGDTGILVQELSNGPTLAFKDMAMQLLGALFQYELGRRGQVLNILGATSGDTGSAAEHAMRGREGIEVFMLSPHGRMSAFQQAQMYSLQDGNIHNLAIEGVFDDAQDIVKAVSADLGFKRAHHVGSVNSINWARLVAQVVYYVAGYLRATDDSTEQVSFTVPSGNFGNVCAGHVARSMGVPIRHLVVATNENDVLDEFFRTGTYRVRDAAETHATSSPSMDISKASNFERFVHDVVGRDGERVRALFGDALATDGAFTLTDDEMARVRDAGFRSGSSSHADRVRTIRDVDATHGRLVDPHTADGLGVATDHVEDGVPMVVLETALPVKFAEIVREAVGREPPRPPALEGLEELPRRVEVLPADLDAVKDHLATHAAG